MASEKTQTKNATNLEKSVDNAASITFVQGHMIASIMVGGRCSTSAVKVTRGLQVR